MNYYYKELPAGYHAVKEIDAVGNKKFAVGMNLAALPLMLVSGAAAWLLRCYPNPAGSTPAFALTPAPRWASVQSETPFST